MVARATESPVCSTAVVSEQSSCEPKQRDCNLSGTGVDLHLLLTGSWFTDHLVRA